jgi:hypothetical protein
MRVQMVVARQEVDDTIAHPEPTQRVAQNCRARPVSDQNL